MKKRVCWEMLGKEGDRSRLSHHFEGKKREGTKSKKLRDDVRRGFAQVQNTKQITQR